MRRLGLILLSANLGRAAEEPRVLAKVNPLPVALDRDFQFRKTKLYFLGETVRRKADKAGGDRAFVERARPRRMLRSLSNGSTVCTAPSPALDQHQRFGNYFDFFWRAKRDADVTMRLEYRQEKLHAHVQAQEISYPNARGGHKTEFKVVGDDYFEDGRVIAWRCLVDRERADRGGEPLLSLGVSKFDSADVDPVS